MVRILLATVVGTVIIYVWLMLAWMVLGYHSNTMQSVPNGEEITAALQSAGLRSGVYHYPGMPEHDPDASQEEIAQIWQDMTARHEAGPIYSIYFHKEGAPVMGSGTLLGAIVIDFASALIVAVLLWSAAPRLPLYVCRVGFVALVGVFAALVAHVSYWNWMLFPLDYTLAMCADVAIGWLLVGLAMGAIIRVPKATEDAKSAEST